MHNRVASETDIYGRRKFRKDDSPVPTTKSCEIKVIKSEDENQDNEEIWAKQKKQFNISKSKSRQHYSLQNFNKLFTTLNHIKVVHHAQAIVQAMDDVKLYAEKVRRTMLRVKVRSNYHKKKLGLMLLKKYIGDVHRKRQNKQIC
jgi:hypothetical protein